MNPHAFHVYLYGPDRGPIGGRFEQAQQRMEQLPGLFFELDGSFAWMRQPGSDEIYGILYDAAGEIQYCDLHGNCSRDTLTQLCAAITTRSLSGLEVLLLPEQDLQDFECFANHWNETAANSRGKPDHG